MAPANGNAVQLHISAHATLLSKGPHCQHRPEMSSAHVSPCEADAACVLLARPFPDQRMAAGLQMSQA